MALIATANVSTRKVITKSLEMKDCYILSRNPNKLNIQYLVLPKPKDPVLIFHPFIEQLVQYKSCDKVLCFCKTYETTCDIYESIALELAQRNVLYPTIDHPEFKLYGQKIRTCEKFDACTAKNLKSGIVDSFTKPDGAVRIVISAIAFSMGLDVPDIHTVVHWGPPNDIECYVQETGRGGRDGKDTRAVLYYTSRDIARNGHVQESMRRYCLNSTECRHQQLMTQFNETGSVATPGTMHMCCVCAELCKCESCAVPTKILLSKEETDKLEVFDDSDTDSKWEAYPTESKEDTDKFELFDDSDTNQELKYQCTLSTSQNQQLFAMLLKLKQEIANTDPTSVLVGADVLSGLTKSTIKHVIENCSTITSVDELHDIGITSPECAASVLKLISDFKQ